MFQTSARYTSKSAEESVLLVEVTFRSHLLGRHVLQYSSVDQCDPAKPMPGLMGVTDSGGVLLQARILQALADVSSDRHRI